jgi:eukaryotic-like serine/threonine-protein kinase
VIIGKQIGSYRILAQHFMGDLQVVYKAVHQVSREVHALKIIRPPAQDESFRRSLESRARLAALDQFHLQKQYPVEYAGELVILPMRFIEAAPLYERILKGPSTYDEVLDVALHAADVLSNMHDAAILHNFLTPGTLFFNRGNHLYVGGAGWSDQFTSCEIPVEDEGLCRSRTIQAPPRPDSPFAYQAPERLQGKAGDARSDLFSLGVILYEMLTGQFLFQGENQNLVQAQILDKPIPMLNQIRPDAPPIWSRIIKYLLVRDPLRRYPSARELCNDLQQIRWGFSIEYPAFIKKSPSFNRRSFFRRFVPDIDI